MAKTGIKKYDLLPARVGHTDVDFIRWAYKKHIDNLFIKNKFIKILDRMIYDLSGKNFVLLKRQLDLVVEVMK